MMPFFPRVFSRVQKILNVLVLPPVESDVESDSSEDLEDQMFNKDSDEESNVPSVNSELMALAALVGDPLKSLFLKLTFFSFGRSISSKIF